MAFMSNGLGCSLSLSLAFIVSANSLRNTTVKSTDISDEPCFQSERTRVNKEKRKKRRQRECFSILHKGASLRRRICLAAISASAQGGLTASMLAETGALCVRVSTTNHRQKLNSLANGILILQYTHRMGTKKKSLERTWL
uniref:Secreted protein n=1 Tax=Rhipicephalus zambeziensis TaxID=60191 RepID=A0A224YFW8_9ACAR